MSSDFTQAQGNEEIQRSLNLSRQRAAPPCEVPGYEPRRFLGAGAYGEVWVAIDRTTGRRVAIKFYLHRGGLDWSLLSHEVEKLAFLSADRYVVQLLDVGWEAEPPYYVMEYVENGSLDERLEQQGPMPAAEATALLREIAIGLTHSHSKGILHCDLKPANILLDQDGKPRLADFGQSRLSSEQTPALGTLFYMAPEQADTRQAVADARWDVYALGAIFYALLVGHPPFRSQQSVSEIDNAPDLAGRLWRYRQLIEQAPLPKEHYEVRGVDNELATIIDRCLAVDPAERFPTVQSVLDVLDARQRRRSRRPLVVLGALGPMLLLAIMAAVAWLWFSTSLRRSNEALTQSALKGLGFAAQSAARGASAELQSRFYDVEEAARDPQIIAALGTMESDPQMHGVLTELNDPAETKNKFNELVDQLRKSPQLTVLQDRLKSFDREMSAENKKSDSWFLTDARGVLVAHWYENVGLLGHNYAWSSSFYDGPTDQPTDWRPAADQYITKTHLSGAHESQSTGLWVVSISTPVFKIDEKDPTQKQFLGVIGVSFQLASNFINLLEEDRQFPVLVDVRKGAHQGLILQHPLLQKLRKESDSHIDRFVNEEKYRISEEQIEQLKDGTANYRDPLGKDDEGTDYRQRYLAAEAPIELLDGEGRDQHEAPSGWVIIVQDPYEQAIGTTLTELRDSLLGSGSVALGVIGVVIFGLWWFVLRMVEAPARWQPATAVAKPDAETVAGR